MKGASGAYRLGRLIVRPAQAQVRLPIALITHGKQRSSAEMALMRAELMLPEARDLAHRGYLAVAVVRRGFVVAMGHPAWRPTHPTRGARWRPDRRYFLVELDDIEAALRAIAERPDADGTRSIAIGGSVGGGAALALARRLLKGLVVAAVNIAGGMPGSRQWCPCLS